MGVKGATKRSAAGNVILGMTIFFLVGAAGCGRSFDQGRKKYSDSRMMIGTYVRIDICASHSQASAVDNVIDRVWERFAQIEARMNAYNPESDVGKINLSDGKDVEVHPDVYTLIQKAVDFSKHTDGAFDVTVRPLIEVWRRARKEKRVPLSNEIDAARQMIGSEKIAFFDSGRSRVSCKGCAIDLGGIAKGFAVDEAVRILRADHFENFLIDAGGDMYASGKNCRGRSWRIGIRDPRSPKDLIDILEISDQAVTTSGDYEQFYEINGRKFSHIIDPVSGYPQQGMISATVMAPTAVEADVLSTVLMVWGADRGIHFIDAKGSNYAAFLIENGEDELPRHHMSAVYQQKKSFKGLSTGYISK